MRGGRLRRVVSILQPTLARTGTGASKITGWTSFAASVFADIDETTGKEQIQAGQVNPAKPVTITIRYLAGVTVEMRVQYGSRTFEIQSALNQDQRNRLLVLTCLEKSP